MLAPNGTFGDIVRTRRQDFGATDLTSTSVPVYSGRPVIYPSIFSTMSIYRQAEDRTRVYLLYLCPSTCLYHKNADWVAEWLES